ncbi:hypothetical protein [Sinomicrobium weinanense]|uniref:Uncharacterized protein n=1 Tax=Sinomicrobium weinanense TaxID=2842200 RepID=A0A926Q1I0_9FLAO|nr:hypothetical protein [Sinomicrobium weinanense]MBC9795772.1 hypothetical protein [Sinomicrobium weinanense]MBU3121816.1 hypothetical protein [Sinomicrobium weinanense]
MMKNVVKKQACTSADLSPGDLQFKKQSVLLPGDYPYNMDFMTFKKLKNPLG